ncbi:hypothetical protein [Duganella callida]|uniref:Uncharacterized protein n=1 Tax=Duganella callida TaxID=2561932 RepID=A0A4Y9SA23_9BURK|nr:hypothetical protein [Duganella callida]TFW18673.1 hypothetical protein E4L98_17660 [Duganella callida]
MTTSTTPQLTPQQVAVVDLAQIAKRLADYWEIDKNLQKDVKVWALAIVDALNFAAKLKENENTKTSIYDEKHKAVLAALNLGCVAGVDLDADGKEVLYMYASGIGVVCVHTEFIQPLPQVGRWADDWSGIKRQQWAPAALNPKAMRDLLEDYTKPQKPLRDSGEFHRKAKAVDRFYHYNDYQA